MDRSRSILSMFATIIFLSAFSQQKITKLSVETIMRDPKWIGTSPSEPAWSIDGKYLFFNWNPDRAVSDSMYYISPTDHIPKKASQDLRLKILTENDVEYNSRRTAYTWSKQGDIYYADVKTNTPVRITQTAEPESGPQFIENDSRIVYLRSQNLYAWSIATGATTQLTNFQKGTAPAEDKKEKLNAQEKWLAQDQLANFSVLRTRKEKRDLVEKANKALPKSSGAKAIYYEDKFLNNVNISPDGRFITWRLIKTVDQPKNTIIPNYVTESGYTQDIAGRSKVEAPSATYQFFIFDMKADTVFPIRNDQIPGIRDKPDYLKSVSKDSLSAQSPMRNVNYYGPYWNEKGTQAVLDIRSQDNKDRWLMLLEAATGKLTLLDRQRDEAWVGGPGIGNFGGDSFRWIDENTYWYQSETGGYANLFKIDVLTGRKTPLLTGNFEVQEVLLSRNRKYFYLTTNAVHPGEKQFYRLPVNGDKPERITTLTGAHQVTVSPDEDQLAILYSSSTKPWELYLQQNKPGGRLQQITFRAQSEEFQSYKWKDPEVITFKARDGATVYARLYKPANQHASRPAVIFVHGAGYLQNAHKWWSSYFREYMFNNLLADNGYTVLDIDYRGSAGYGRDWRTGIYRHMGGKDLDDQVDAARLLTKEYNVDSNRIGLYGGSYGGFITLMAMFNQPDVFKAGAALRSVTDWAHYNHGYTSNILNEPFTDSIAYKRSSPIYFAEGLKGHLLMCHGMVDVNVHFQDIVRLSQRLIELGKNNWELAVYPMEDHAFIEPSSWTDEYKRIYKLFEANLK